MVMITMRYLQASSETITPLEFVLSMISSSYATESPTEIVWTPMKKLLQLVHVRERQALLKAGQGIHRLRGGLHDVL